MKTKDPIEAVRTRVRGFMQKLATALNKLTRGKISPNFVTIFGLLMHIPIAWLIATSVHNILAALLLVFFGLFDTLDGSLARVQGSASNAGMLLDAVTDRMKEVLLYCGVAVAIVNGLNGGDAIYTLNYTHIVFPIAACGGSLLVSYVKAKGETVVAGKLPASEVNRLFQDGLMRFEIRMSILVLGLLANSLFLAVVIIAVTSWYTALSRLISISRKLS